MKINVNTGKRTLKMRILSAFMAFLIFTMTCPELFEGWGIGLIVHAEEPSGNIHYTNTDNTSLYKDAMNTNRTGNTSAPNTMLAQGSGQPHTGNTFTYTGKYNNNNKTTVFDYVSDYELRSGGSYNICLQNESGYVDAYTMLNQAISDSTPNNNSSSNITFIYKPTRKNVTVARIHLFDDLGHSTTWPGYTMNYDSSRKAYVLTMNFDTLKSALGGCAPEKFIISGYDEMAPSSGNNFQTETITTGTMQAGTSYTYSDYQESVGTANKITFTLNKNQATVLKGYETSSYDCTYTGSVNNMYIVNGDDGWKLADGGWNNVAYDAYVFANIWDDHGHDNSCNDQMNASNTAWSCTIDNLNNYDEYFYVTFKSRKYGNKNEKYLFCTNDDNRCWGETDIFKVRKGYNYNFNGHVDTGTADNTNCQYSRPLYFGDFWLSNSASGYTSANKPSYNNFYWQSSIGMKSRNNVQDEDTTNADHFNQRGHAVVQDLVYDKLSGSTLNAANATGDILDKSGVSTAGNTISGNALPLFSTAWINDANHTERTSLIKYYDTDTVDGKDYNITFPFYETYSEFNNSSGSNTINSGTVKLKTYDDGWCSNGEVARFYQFDSKEANLKFNITSVDDHKGYFSETTGEADSDIYFGSSIDSDRGNVGFFPFNSSNWYNSNNSRENKHNLGFGTKMSMDFQLENDGCVSAVKLNNSTGKLESLDTETRIHTIFEFTGDDDLWVFIDGNLVLDMGGPHYAAHGIIDFADMSATADPALKFGTNSSGTETTAYDALDAAITTKTLSGSDFIAKLAGNNTTDGSGNPTYDTSVTHTMTIFYMERGMLDSNLLIRYNYSPISNTSRMKIAEVTKFTGVNSGLLELTKQAAEDDVFKYTISNTIPEGVTTETPLDSGAKYPVTTKHERTAEDRTTKTVLTHDLDNTTPAEKKFTPGAADTPTYVKDTAYWWVDGFSDTDYLAGKTTNASVTAGQSGYKPGGDFWLMYGTNDSVYDSTNTGKESSAEFEKQFTRGSKMTIVQGDNIYRINQPEPGDPRTLFDVSGNLTAKEWDGQVHTDEDGAGASARPSRAVDDYYTTKYRLVDRKFNQLFYETSETYTAIGQNARNATFTFSNDDGVSEHLATMLTEYVENTVRVGTLLITNRIENGDPGQEFTYTIKLDNVFGVGGEVSDYTALSATKSTIPTTSGSSRPVKTTSTSAVENNFMTNSVSGNTATFKLKDGEQVVITGIPLGTTYSVTQQDVSDQGFTTNVTGSDNTTATVSTLNGSGWPYKGHENQAVHFKSTRQSEYTAEKQDETGAGLPNAEMKLYFREQSTPPTFSFNEPKVVPMKKIQNKIPSGNGITLPDPEIISGTIEIKKTTIEYGSDTPPTASDSDWILPRNDSDYIYFRDYNDANGGFLGDKDKTSFGSSGKVAWRETKFEDPSTNNGVHGQNEEIGFKDEGEGKYPWVAAQFTKKNGQDFVEYAVWERFVDTYNGIQTVVWKIQPPDGYDEVRFCLYYGDKCVRTTKRFKFKLGKIYHKTNWGSSYSSDNGGSYWDVPVKVETANSGYWAPVNASVNDKRMSDSTMAQARKYEPTEQKIIFHCNSQEVWHNIHIEFFEDAAGTIPVNGQPFPGYMMEPYAYAGSDYRLSDGYLTYELTIPKTANYFRINNGVDNSPEKGSYSLDTVAGGQSRYAYRTNIQKISKNGDKNHDNYYVLSTTGSNVRAECLSGGNPIEVQLSKSVSAITNLSGENTNVSYTDKDVDSDYDYIYFEKPSGWKDHVYAYFYGGGNLRADNWQRACYSAWPGVAAAGTEYTDNGTKYYSSTYNYPIADDDNDTTLEKYNGTTLAANKLSPESTFKNSNGKTVYKFRIPKGDRKNYSKVIFNDGLSSQGGKYETGVIDYRPGYLYKSDGSCQKHYDNNPTVTYATRGGANDYIYVKIDSTTANTWDDPHITFYDNYGRQVLQGGHGYVMDYAGTKTVNEGTAEQPNNVTYQYYRIPIPADSTGATKFKINNGISRPNETTTFYDILKKGTHEGTVTSTDYTEGKLVYKLSGNALTRTEPTFKETEVNEDPITISNEQNSGVNYDHTRGDKLKILDDAPWITVTNAGDGIGTVKVKFYNSSGTVIGTKGIYTMIQSKADADGKRWYSIEIPDGAAKFTLTYPNGTTAPYDIYEYSPNSDGEDANNTTIDGNWTADGMYYRTKSDKTLELISSTVQATGNTVEANDETYSKRGDNLYLVTSDTFSDIKVVFYGADGTAFQTDANAITAKYIADDGSDHWYKVSIPKNAVSFKVLANDGTITLQQADIYELKTKIARYKENYTLGDMQYRITATNNSKPTLLYPVFTQDDEYTIDVGGNTISSRSGLAQVDESAVSGYSEVGVTPADSSSSEPSGVVLYNTTAVTTGNYQQAADSSNVVKNWTDGTGSSSGTVKIYCDISSMSPWSDVNAYIWYESGGSATKYNGEWPGNAMSSEGGGVYSVNVGSWSSGTQVIFSNDGSDQTENITLPNDFATQSYDYTLSKTTEYTVRDRIYIVKPINAYTDNSSISWQVMKMQLRKPNGSGWTYSGVKSLSDTVNGSDLVKNSDGSPINYSHSIYYYPISSSDGWTQVEFWDGDTNGTRGKVDWTNLSDNGVGNYLNFTSGNYHTSINAVTNIVVKEKPYVTYSVQQHEDDINYTATYQIEDRYGYVSSINSAYGDTADDKNNYIYINTSNVTTSGFAPYVRFYTNTAGNEGEICGVNTTDSTDTINIKADQVATNLYRVRLPKNAKSFKIFNGKYSASGSSAILLEETVTVDASTGEIATAGVGTVPITGFRHAGTTFKLNAAGDGVASKTLRSGYTVNKDEAMADPLNPKTDADFVYFTDTGSFANDGKVYAYYYGDVDGAYTSWPGVKAMTPNNGVADTTYTDNNGNKVYAFRIPKGSEGKYSKVIFTNGKTDSNIKITQAQDLTGGANYVLTVDNNDDPVSGGRNGEFAAAAYTASTTAANQKSSMPTVDYSTSEGKTIYIINNGTPDSVTGSGSSVTVSRTPLDDMHIVFYDASNNAINHTDGYKPNKVVDEQYERTDVYKITVPDNAEYFRITNGTGKGSSGGRERHSEIKKLTDKGLYRFIEPSEVTATNKDASSENNYVQGTTFNSTLSANTYLLGLANQIQESDEELPETNTTDIYLATIVTGSDGKQDYIKDLRQIPNPDYNPQDANSEAMIVDTAYLQHTNADIGPTANNGTSNTGFETVKVVKSGEYYWKESKAPTGYQIDESLKAATGDTTIIGDKPIKGKLKLVKELADGMPSSLDSQNFVYTVTLTAPTVPVAKKFVNDGGTIKIQNADGTGTATALGITLESGSYKTDPSLVDATHIKFEVEVSKSAYIVVRDIPYDVGYSVSEAMPDRTWKRVSPSGTEPITGKITANDTYTATFTNAKTEEPTGEVILTKTAKEKVGTTDIGDTLAGAKFKLVDVNETDSTKVIKFKLTQVDPDTTDTDTRKTNIYTVDNSGSYNVTYSWLETGEDGKLHIKGLPIGDYYLEEQVAPNGYSNLDSNRLDNSGNAQPKRVYFSAGDNTKLKNITCSDEMAPAYIKLFEHISEWRPSEWGNPTFIFKIKQTGYYAWSEPAEPEEGEEPTVPVWQLTTTNSGKEILVALTVNDDGTLNTNVLTGSVTGKTFTGWKVESTDENIAVDENTTVKEYQGMFDIDSQGRIRVEPGSYEITRMPISRYEFVTSAATEPYDNGSTAGDQTENLDSNSKPLEKVTISPLEAGKTVDVHYYDEVGYYDKFSQVDTNVNQFYQLNSTTKANKTIKGIRILDYHQVGKIGDDADTVDVTDDSVEPPVTTQTMTVPVANLKIYKIMSDGSEVEMTDSEKAALTGTNFIVSYTYDLESGDKESFGHATSPATNDFSYDNTDEDSNDLGKNPSIVVHNSQKYENGVYTLKAKYKTDANTEFTTTFDLVFLRSST